VHFLGRRYDRALADGLRSLQNLVDLSHVPGEAWLDAQHRVRQVAMSLAITSAGHAVSVVTTFPNHPLGHIPPAYRGRWWATFAALLVGTVITATSNPAHAFDSPATLYRPLARASESTSGVTSSM